MTTPLRFFLAGNQFCSTLGLDTGTIGAHWLLLNLQGAMAGHLERELAVYERLLPSLLPQEGKFAVIYGDDLLGVFGTYEDALKVGYEKAQLNPFLVKKISGAETVAYFSRDFAAPCHI